MQFEKITLEIQDQYLELLARVSRKTSDYSFINLWGWSEEYGLRWCMHHGLFWIMQLLPEPRWWAPVGDWGATDWQQALVDVLAETGSFVRIPGALAHLWETALVTPPRISDDRGQWDYLYDFNSLAELTGNRYHKKKNLLNQFERNYDYRYMPMGPGTVDQTLVMQADWCAWKDCQAHHVLESENRVIRRVLSAWSELKGIIGGAIRVKDAIVAYTVAEALDEKTLLIHFEKGNPAYRGVYQAINQIFLSRNHGFLWVNREQDLGDTGLRKAKESYHPAAFGKKYRLRFDVKSPVSGRRGID